MIRLLNRFNRLALMTLALLWLPTPSFGQGAYIPAKQVLSTVNGQLRGIQATVTVCAPNTAGLPCAPASANTLFKDAALTQPLANPTTTDALGNYPQMALAGGNYTITETAAGFVGFSYQVSVSCPGTGGSCSVTNLTVSGTATLPNLNNTLYVSQFAGADLGAKMNAAVATCSATFTSCRYILDTNGAISTPPNFPMGSIVECTATGQITLSTTWTIAHRNTTFFFNGCQFNYNLDVGGSAFYIGKNASGTVNTQNAATGGCAGNCATFATGTNFANIDQYDVVYINAAVYNVCSVQSATVLTLCAPPGTQAGVTYGARLTNSLIAGAPYPASVTIRDLNVTYTGAGTTTSIGVNNVLANQVDATNVRVYNFTGNQSVGWNMLGAEDYTVYKLILSSNKCQMVLDQGTIGGLNVASSMNRFVLPLLQSGGACTSPTTAAVTIQNSAFGNEFSQPDLEGNTSTYTFNILLSSFKNIIEGADFETNGDSTAGSIDVLIQSGTGNIVKDSRFTSLAVNKPATGLFCSGVGVFCTFTNDTWGPASSYTTAWNFSGSSVGLVQANQPGAAAHGDPLNVQDASGNYTVASLTSSGAVTATTRVISPSVGPSSGQQHTVPAVASDTFALLVNPQKFTGINNFPGNTAALTADWTCGTGGTVASCVAATIIGSGGGVPLTFTLPLVAQSYTLECDGVVGQATAATANQWNLLTATNGATNVTANYDMYTAATAKAGGAVTDQASTTTTFQIAPSWTLGGTATKMPFHIWAKIEGASASGTVVSLQLVAPTVADLVTIYRGAACRVF